MRKKDREQISICFKGKSAEPKVREKTMDEREGEKKTDRGKPLHTEIQRVQRNTETDRDIQSYIHVHTEIHTEIHRDTHRDTERDENRKAQSNPFFFSLSPSLPLSLSLSLSLSL